MFRCATNAAQTYLLLYISERPIFCAMEARSVIQPYWELDDDLAWNVAPIFVLARVCRVVLMKICPGNGPRLCLSSAPLSSTICTFLWQMVCSFFPGAGLLYWLQRDEGLSEPSLFAEESFGFMFNLEFVAFVLLVLYPRVCFVPNEPRAVAAKYFDIKVFSI